MSRVGFLWDSISANAGDQAIGLSLLRRARRAGITKLEPVRIGDPLADRFDMLVIGGGELLHPAGDPFYDVFRVPGEHVLNTVGASCDLEAGYLSSYRLVTVRSSADREHLQGVSRSVKVAPCLSMLFDGLAEDRAVPSARSSILLHLHAGAFKPETAVETVALLRKLSRPVAFLPFTPYICDGALQAELAAAAELAPPLDIAGPDQAFAAIRAARAVVVASLHAAIFAYISGVPFLAISYVPKMRHFLADRGLEHRLLPDILQLPEKIHLLEPGSVDWHAGAAADQKAAGDLADEILAHVEDAASIRVSGGSGRAVWSEQALPEKAHAEMMSRISHFGFRRARMTADILAGRHRWRRSIAGAVKELATRIPGVRRWSLARAIWRWLGAHGC